MIARYNFHIDERRVGIKINKIYKSEYRFPIEMTAYGERYDGVEYTLNKPHGKKIVMQFVLQLLVIGPKQYRTVIKHVINRFSWLDIRDTLEILLLDGIIQIIFKNQQPRKNIDWFPKIVQIDPRALEYFIKDKPKYDLELEICKKYILDLTVNLKDARKNELFRWLEEKQIKDASGSIIAESLSFKKFKSIVLSIANYFYLKEYGEKLPLRYLSNQIWNQPKVLVSYREEIARSIGITLQELDAVLVPDKNETLYASLISITSIEDLQKIINKFIEGEIQRDKIFDYISEINHSVQAIIALFRNLKSDDLSSFLSIHEAIIKLRIDKVDQDKILPLLKEFQQSIGNLKKYMLKEESIKSQYELIILDEIGSGSFARVYKVFDPEIKKEVACKVLFPRTYFKQIYGNEGDEYIKRFKREVRLLMEDLEHGNIVEILKVQIGNSPFWFTMPLANLSLNNWMKTNPNASQKERINIFKQIIEGVKYLHDNEKYHRDLAPNNILLYESNDELKVKIADFGLAKDPKSVSFFTGLSKQNYGQEGFADPEQLKHFSYANHLSDIYSLGALLYYLLSNKLPKKRFYAPIVCQNIVTKAMDKPRQRYQSVHEFEKDFNRFEQS